MTGWGELRKGVGDIMVMMRRQDECCCCTSRVAWHACRVIRHTSHVTRHTSYVTRHTSHNTRHTSHNTRHSFYSRFTDVHWQTTSTQVHPSNADKPRPLPPNPLPLPFLLQLLLPDDGCDPAHCTVARGCGCERASWGGGGEGGVDVVLVKFVRKASGMCDV